MSQVASRTETQQSTVATPTTRRTNRLAGWGLALSILTLGGVGSILGIVFGVKARKHALQSDGRGAGLALAAIIVGVVTLLVAIAYWIVIAQHVGGSSGGGNGGSGY